jgi:tripartite-type tricarboxylate transporter receptor subunit TctC
MFARIIAAAFAACFASTAPAQSYPSRPVRLVVPYPPGGGTDIIGRVVAQKIGDALGQQVVVDNRGGAAGIIAMEAVAKAAPDGYTLIQTNISTVSINPFIYSKLPYDAMRDFAPVSITTLNPLVLVVHPAVPVKTVKEVIALARSRPGQLNYSSAGIGSTTHMARELFKSMAHVDLTHIPYKGAAPAVMDGVAGHVAMLFGPMPVVTPHAKAGRLRIIAVSTKARSRAIPNVPTVAESGVPGYDATNSVGIVAPAATPADIVAKLHAEIVRILRLPDMQEKLIAMGAEPVASTPQEFTAFIRDETRKWANVVRSANIAPQPW